MYIILQKAHTIVSHQGIASGGLFYGLGKIIRFFHKEFFFNSQRMHNSVPQERAERRIFYENVQSCLSFGQL